MKVYVCALLVIACYGYGQTVQQCKQRFDKYLNFRASLNKTVVFENEAIFFVNGKGKRELAVYADELASLSKFFENASFQNQEKFITTKGLKHYTKQQLDSLEGLSVSARVYSKPNDGKALSGFRIAIDPGHFSITLEEALVEQKYLFFTKKNANASIDTFLIFESVLNFNTARILQKMLEEQGANVFMTKNEPGHTSFDCTFSHWMTHHKKRVLDSLKKENALTLQRYNLLMKADDHKFFWDFFRDYDLANRCKKMNAYLPHLSLIIHYNVDEKNKPWERHSFKNFTMAFIGGAFIDDNLHKPGVKADFLRLLLTDQLDRSQDLARETVANFNKNLAIPIAKQGDADYLLNNCISTSSPGVFCRNLALCRRVNSPLVYGESLYQDNIYETGELMKTDLDLYGLKANKRLVKVANSYYDAILKYLNDYYIKAN